MPRPHGLRHQAITRALDLGRDLRDVAKFARRFERRDIPRAQANDPDSHEHYYISMFDYFYFEDIATF
jgi:hypothetical protein